MVAAARASILSSRGDTISLMTEARDLAEDSQLEPDELAWLQARIEEYRELLEYLRDH